MTGLSYRLHNREPDAELMFSDEQTLAIFRILQESLANIAQHARATTVDVEFDFSENRQVFYLDISDDGVGMTEADARKHKSFGLAGIHERLHAFNGKLIIDSAPGRGTTLAISMPVARPG